jgi:hypothetical protein
MRQTEAQDVSSVRLDYSDLVLALRTISVKEVGQVLSESDNWNPLRAGRGLKFGALLNGKAQSM